MSIFDDILQAQELLNRVVVNLNALGSTDGSGWSKPDADGYRLYSPLFQHRINCIKGGYTPENRALWYFGQTAQLLNIKFMVAFNEEDQEKMMDAWVACQNTYFPGITSYIYPYPGGIQMPYDGGLYPPYMQWYSNKYPMEAKEIFEDNIATHWTWANVERWAQEDIEMMDWKYDQSAYSHGGYQEFLDANPWYYPPEGWDVPDGWEYKPPK